MNELTIVEKLETKTTQQLLNEFRKSLDIFKKSSGKTALALYLYLKRFDSKKERAEAVKMVMEDSGLSKSSISQLNKAGEYIYNNPDVMELGSTAVYQLAKNQEVEDVEESTETEVEDVEESTETEVEDVEESTEGEKELDLISITCDRDMWRDIFIATAKSKNANVQLLREWIDNKLKREGE